MMVRLDALFAEFDLAVSEARAMGFACPTQAARDVARRLLRRLAGLSDERVLDVAVGEDGTIEITASSKASIATVEVSPSESLTRLILRDLRTGAVTPVASGLSKEEVARRIEQAA